MPTTTYRTARNNSSIDRPSLIAEISKDIIFFFSTNHFGDILRNILDKHARLTMRNIENLNFSPWYDSIRHDYFKAKKERRGVEKNGETLR